MALKKIVTKEEFAKLPKAVQAEYKADGDDGENYTLEVEGGFDTGLTEMKRAKDAEVKQHNAAKKKIEELTTQLAALETEKTEMLKGVIPKGDAEKLESSYKTKLAALEKEKGDLISGLEGNLRRILVDGEASKIAAELSDSPVVILPHIKARLAAEKDSDGTWKTRVLDGEGKPSALTLDELKKNFLADKAFSGIVRASKASGGGANGGSGGGGAGSGSKIDFKASPKDIAAAMRTSGKAPAVS